MRLLALDTATEACSAALAINGEILERSCEPGTGHAQLILTMIDELLAEAGTSLNSMTGIASGIGPGAFTGVRIAVSVAQGLAYGASLPIIGVNSLEALAMALSRSDSLHPIDVLACLDARMGEVYWAGYRTDSKQGLSALLRPAVSAPSDVRAAAGTRLRGVGRGFRAYPDLAHIPGLTLDPADAQRLPQAGQIARLALIRAVEPGAWLDSAALQPLYLRDHVARTEAERAEAARKSVMQSS